MKEVEGKKKTRTWKHGVYVKTVLRRQQAEKEEKLKREKQSCTIAGGESWRHEELEEQQQNV